MVLSARIETYVNDAAFCSLSTTDCVRLIGQDSVAAPHLGRSTASRLFSRSSSVIFIPFAVASSVQLEVSVTNLLSGCITAELMLNRGEVSQWSGNVRSTTSLGISRLKRVNARSEKNRTSLNTNHKAVECGWNCCC